MIKLTDEILMLLTCLEDATERYEDGMITGKEVCEAIVEYSMVVRNRPEMIEALSKAREPVS